MVLECSRSHDAIRRRKNRPFIGNACPKCKRFSSVSPPISREIRRRLRLCRASRSIRLRYRPIARWAIRALFRPIARWAIRAHFRPIARWAIRALFSPYCPLGNTGSFSPGVALRYTPGCVLAPIQGAGGGIDRMGWGTSGFAPRVFAPGCVLAPFQGANSRSVRN